MSKKFFLNPFVIATLDIDDDDEFTGGGTGEYGVNPFPMSLSDWLGNTGYAFDYNEDNIYDKADYLIWWNAQDPAYGFTPEKYQELNGEPLP